MVRHNWVPIRGGYQCVIPSPVDKGNCLGCWAIILMKQVVGTDLNGLERDVIWHKHLRPMAELVGLVEESACQ